MFKTISEYKHEKIIYCYDGNVGLKAIIAIHSTALGPAFGGCRMKKYNSDEDALFDVLRLSQYMSLKNAVANVSAGGGKSVIIADPQTEKTPELLESFALAVDSLGGMYYTAPDLNMSVVDLNYIGKFTKYMMGGDFSETFGNPSMATAYGVYLGIKTGMEIKFGYKNLAGVKVAVQGVGQVGTCLVELLSKDGAKILVADTNQERIDNVKGKFDVKIVKPEDIYDVDCDIFSPAAQGGIINENTIPRLKCKLIAGAANNQLLKNSDAELLHRRNIYFIPDFIISCGGVIMGEAEVKGYTYDQAFKKIEIVKDNVHKVDTIAREKDITPNQAAFEMAWERIKEAKQK